MFNAVRAFKDIAILTMVSGITFMSMPGIVLSSSRENVPAKRTAAPFFMADNKPAEGEEIDAEKHRADYDIVRYGDENKSRADIRIDGTKVVFELEDDDDSITALAIGYYDGKTKKATTGEGTAELELEGIIDEGEIFYLDYYFEFDDMSQESMAITISADADGNLYFIEPPALEHNREAMQKIYRFVDPYKDFLGSQTDVEIDNPDVRRFALDLCKDLKTDRAKVMRIYEFIVEEMYYDNDVLVDDNAGLEDDVLTLIRRKVGVCEGFSNVFVALCRVNGIPATEIYGSAYNYDEIWDINFEDLDYGNHAWVTFFVDGNWYMADPTWDNFNKYEEGEYYDDVSSRDFLFVPLEVLSYTHVILNADFSHTTESTGSCGPSATYRISKDGVCTIYGYGEINMPKDVNDFFEVKFDKDSEITAIGTDAFIDCDQLRIVILPETLEDIGMGAFCSCEDLEYIYIPDSVKIIRTDAFCYCDKLAYVSVPDDTVVDDYAFEGCPRLILEVADAYTADTDDYVTKPARVITRK